jgi:hypothetical protein
MSLYGQFQDKGVKGKNPSALPKVFVKNTEFTKSNNSRLKFGNKRFRAKRRFNKKS